MIFVSEKTMLRCDRERRAAAIVAAYSAGYSCAEIGRELDIDRATVYRVVKKSGIELRAAPGPGRAIKWTSEMDARLTELSRSGMGALVISEDIGVSLGLVIRRRKELGLPTGLESWKGRAIHRQYWVKKLRARATQESERS
ncbi:helix-turn-helix domain-containing protein [Sphingomonas oryzagri]|uniref:helix-turn-helix domain-containing protein n=1 Tax=Sphingomonas oryzagri TaxID=3042314 RepID=UPI0036F28C1D